MDTMDGSSFDISQEQTLSFNTQNTCGSNNGGNEEYNLGLHIFALFLTLVCGAAACSFPVVVNAYPRLAFSRYALFLSRHFGTGVLIALAFAHLLPEAFEKLWKDCLPLFWTEGYNAMPGVIALGSALAVMLLEMGFTLQGVRHSHALGTMEEPEERSSRGIKDGSEQSESISSERSRLLGLGTSRPSNDNRAGAHNAFNAKTVGATIGETSDQAYKGNTEHQSNVSYATEIPLTKQQEQRMILQCLLLEAGILFHGVFIGLSISLSSGTTFIALMVAISFHQIFEGLALGARIAAIPNLHVSSLKPWAMSFAYGMTCPLGQALGMGLRDAYDPEGMAGLLAVGIANAISAGMIMYAGLVQLLGEDLLSEESYRKLGLRRRMEATAALLLGCTLMALIAIWA